MVLSGIRIIHLREEKRTIWTTFDKKRNGYMLFYR